MTRGWTSRSRRGPRHFRGLGARAWPWVRQDGHEPESSVPSEPPRPTTAGTSPTATREVGVRLMGHERRVTFRTTPARASAWRPPSSRSIEVESTSIQTLSNFSLLDNSTDSTSCVFPTRPWTANWSRTYLGLTVGLTGGPNTRRLAPATSPDPAAADPRRGVDAPARRTRWAEIGALPLMADEPIRRQIALPRRPDDVPADQVGMRLHTAKRTASLSNSGSVSLPARRLAPRRLEDTATEIQSDGAPDARRGDKHGSRPLRAYICASDAPA